MKETDRGPLASHMQRARTIKQLKAGGELIESEKTDVNHYSCQTIVYPQTPTLGN